MSSSRRRVDHFAHHENHITSQALHSSLLTDLKNHHTQDGAGGGSKLGVMTDSIASSNNTISSQSVLTASRLNNIQNAITQDGLGGGNKLGVMTDAINTNVIASNAKLDSIVTNTANIKLTADSVNLNVDTLEAKTEAISNAQTQDGAGGGNKPGVMLDAINTNTIAGNAKLDTIITNTASSSSSGLSTEAKQDTLINGQTQNGDGTGNKLGVMIDAINTNTITGNGKIDTTNSRLGTINTSIGTVDTSLGTVITQFRGQTQDGNGGGNKLGVMIDAINTNTITQNGKIDDTNTKLDTLETTANAIQSAVEAIDNAVDGNYLNVNQNIAGTDVDGNSGNKSAQTQRVVIATDDIPIALVNTNLTNIDSVLDAIKIDTEAIETAVELLDDLAIAEDTAHSTGHKGVQMLAVRQDAQADFGADGDYVPMSIDGNGDLRVKLDDVSNAVLDEIQTNGDNIQTKLDTIDNVLDAIKLDTEAIETAVELLDDIAIAEDTAHSTGQKGVQMLGVRQDTQADFGADGDYVPMSIDANGDVRVKLDDVSNAVLDDIKSAVETVETAYGLNKCNINISSDAVGLATSANLTAGTAINKVMGSEDGATTGTQRQLKVNASSQLEVRSKKAYSTETSYISGQAVSGSGNHTGSAVTNDANITDYLFEHNFSGSDVSYEILESLDNSNFFATGQSFNQAGDPSTAITGINGAQIKSPYFKVKFTNGNGSSRDVTLSYVTIST